MLKSVDNSYVKYETGLKTERYNAMLSLWLYRDRLKGMQMLLSRTQAEPGRRVKQEQEDISRNHVQAF